MIDGGSSDDTAAIIQRYADRITYYVSEPDNGIYDAMNKGIKVATGEWINFMNSGDTFHSSDTIESVFLQANLNSDIIYGDTNLVLNIGNYIRLASDVSDKNYMPFGHQAVFSRTTLMQSHGFDLNYRICADRKFFYDVYHQGAKFEHIPITVSNYESDSGLSSVNKIRRMYEIGMIEVKTNKIGWRIDFGFCSVIWTIKPWFKKHLPKGLINSIRTRCYDAKQSSNTRP